MRGLKTTFISVGVACTLLAGAVTPAQAAKCPGKPGRKTASKLSDRGLVAVDEGRHADAARLFDDAFACDHHPTLLWNAARAYEKAGELDVARDRFVTYRGLPGLEPARAAEANEQVRAIDDIKRRDANAGRLAGRVLGALREPAPRSPKSTKRPVADPKPAPRRGRGQRTAGYVLLGAGVATAAVGFVFMDRANHAYDGLNEQFGAGIAEGDTARLAQYDEARASAIEGADRDKRTMWAFFGAGAAAAVTGTILVLTAPKDRAVAPKVTLTGIGASPLPGGAFASGAFRF